jgi:hypothetical protein
LLVLVGIVGPLPPKTNTQSRSEAAAKLFRTGGSVPPAAGSGFSAVQCRLI